MSNPGNSQQSFDVADEDFASPRVTKESAPNENKNIKNPKAVQKVVSIILMKSNNYTIGPLRNYIFHV
ncbi:hypothetical protein Lalb_Chr21g0306301 [Lupinus albus]|uniref:Uncharacterized protein n=1 Tax=Lupinus albus TaxID=3870 RepID=A0A6A4NP58_LUPAL|nr:hypothetical protein Lalb_Chr21g0306301 [Lupinus albus]